MRFSFNDEERQLFKEVEAIEAKIISHEESLNEERNSKSQLSLSSRNIEGCLTLVFISHLTLTTNRKNKSFNLIKH